jgi:outer membrane receptor protein involved in Fe transport
MKSVPAMRKSLKWMFATSVAVSFLCADVVVAQSAGGNAGHGTDSAVPLQEITVTATRVQRTNFTAPTPTTVLSAQDLEKTGSTNVGDMTSMVPAFQATGTPTTSVLGSDTGRGHFLDLRGLGPSRTLVLVDGQRFVPTTANGLLDTDVIPAALVERIEVVTGGASASWGSDAVAGVVNVILKKDLNGFEANFQETVSQRDDNREPKIALAYGHAFADGRGHFTVAAEYSDNKGILHQSERAWSGQDWGYIQANGYQNVPVPGARLSIASFGGLILSGPLAGMQFAPGGTLVPFSYGTNVSPLYMQGGDGAVFAPYSALEVPLQRSSVYVRTSFDLNDRLTAFADASFAQTVTDNPNLVQNFDLTDTLSTDNAFLAPTIRNQMLAAGQTSFVLGRLDNDFGFIRSIDDNRVSRVVAGLKGKFPDTWTWNAYVEYGHVLHYNSLEGVVNTANYALALDSVDNPATGRPICRSTLTTPGNGCVPINIFGVGSPSAAAVQYATGNEQTALRYVQKVAAASIQGEPFSTWAGPASIASGVEYRKESADSNVDPGQEAGVYLIGNGQSFSGSFNVKEGFLETVLPVYAGAAPFKSVDLDLGARYTDYSSSGRVTTWKGGLSYGITDELRFRATRSRDIRAPNLSELYQTGTLNFTNVNDPANGGAAAFIRNPMPPNPALQPEKADTTTIGLIYQPAWLAGLHTAIDAYDINLKNVISQLTPQDALNRCYAGDSTLCSLVQRDPSGNLLQIATPYINLDNFHTRGLDLEARYDTLLPVGHLTFRALANYVDRFASSDGATTVNEAGAVGSVNLPSNIGASAGVPHWRATLSTTYGVGPITAYVEGRFIGEAKVDNLYGPTDIPDNHVSSRFYVNTSLAYKLPTREGHLELYAVINNLFDLDPPIIVSTFISPQATNPALYDVIGRSFVVGVRFRQ